TALRAAGAEVSEIPLGMDVDRGAVAAALAGHADVDGVVSLAAALPGWWPGAPGVPNAVVATVALVQGLGDAGLETPLWTVTGGVVVTSQDDGAGDPVQAAVWGLGRVAALEHPDRWGGLVDVASGHADRLASVLSGVEDQVAIRSTGTYARRLRENPYRGPAEWRPPGGTVLITGGTGGLGGHTARWVAGRGAERVVLASRSGGRAPGADALVDELRAAGVDVEVVACDLTDRDAVAALLEIADADRPLRMVVHAAGVGQLGALDDLTTAEAAEVMAAKVLGARHLDDCLGDRELAAFLVFSSVSGVWGSGAQPAYAAANAYLDGVVAGRRARGLAGTSVAWGPWAGAGMAEHADLAQYERRGLPAMAPETAVTALEQALAAGDPTLVVADVDWSRFHPTFTAARPSPLLTGFGRNAGSGGRASGDRLRAHVAGLPADEAESHLVGLVRGHAAAVLGFAAPEAVDTTHGFLALGLDSVGAVEFRDRLVRVTGLDITATVVYDHPTITAVARHLADRLSPAADTFDAIVSTLDSLDRSLDALSGAGQRAELAHRLSALAERLDRDTGIRSADDVSKSLNDATGDELREFLSNEFGIA
ncbi:MAG TPA: SDR family NAD(P)-dependent oxidoreductase, partial [Actinophytocola sp.]|nr:SDR family NAD(P)-dependent oxidoreductase [Actinophytocola sp.]